MHYALYDYHQFNNTWIQLFLDIYNNYKKKKTQSLGTLVEI